MTSYVAGQALARDFPQVERRVYLLPSIATVIRDGQAIAVARRRRWSTGPSSTSSPSRSSTATRAPRSPSRDRWCSRESEALRAVRRRTIRSGETLTVAVSGRNVDHRVSGVMRDLPRNSHMRLDMLDPLRSGQPTSPTARLPHRLGLAGGWVYVALRPGSDGRGDPPPDAGLGGAQHPRSSRRRDRFPRPAGLAPGQPPRHPSRRGAGRRRGARQRPRHDRHLRDRRRC